MMLFKLRLFMFQRQPGQKYNYANHPNRRPEKLAGALTQDLQNFGLKMAKFLYFLGR
jgi:hypothetical protein